MTEPRKAASEIRAVLIPLDGGRLLLPNAAVAEVIGYKEPQRGNGAPEWLLGEIDWRQQRVSVVGFEQASGKGGTAIGPRARIVVCNTLSGNPRRPYLGILAQAIPRLVRLTEGSVDASASETPSAPAVLREVSVEGELAWIPDLDELERMLDGAQSA